MVLKRKNIINAQILLGSILIAISIIMFLIFYSISMDAMYTGLENISESNFSLEHVLIQSNSIVQASYTLIIITIFGSVLLGALGIFIVLRGLEKKSS